MDEDNTAGGGGAADSGTSAKEDEAKDAAE